MPCTRVCLLHMLCGKLSPASTQHPAPRYPPLLTCEWLLPSTLGSSMVAILEMTCAAARRTCLCPDASAIVLRGAEEQEVSARRREGKRRAKAVCRVDGDAQRVVCEVVKCCVAHVSCET
eukprot:1083562-Rhodomonas_salina.1